MKVARVEAIGQLSPLERGRHRSSGFGAHAVGTSDGLALDVLQVVDVNRCGTASFDESLDRRLFRMPGGYFRSNNLSDLRSSVVRCARRKR